MPTSFDEASSVRAIDSHTYAGQFFEDWCNGTVPHGGYVTSCFQSVAKLHFSTTHPNQNQPHTIAVQLSFLRRTGIGPTTFTVTDLKLGQRTSVISITLTQPRPQSSASTTTPPPAPLVIAIITQSNIHTESGLSIPTSSILSPSPLPLRSPPALLSNIDPNYQLEESQFSKFTKSSQHIHSYQPRPPRTRTGEVDQWITLAHHNRGTGRSRRRRGFTQEMLGYVVDCFPQFIQTDTNLPELHSEIKRLKLRDVEHRGSHYNDGDTAAEKKKIVEAQPWARFWYPTVLLNMEIKKVLPEDGAEWLFSRVTARRIRDGRADLDVVVLDEEGEIVAISNHVALVVGVERNTNRGTGEQEEGKEEARSKL